VVVVPRARAVTVPATGENGSVTTPMNLSVDEIVEVLSSGRDRPLGPGVDVSQLDHALQTASVLACQHPDDVELAAAGLVHDIGHLVQGGTDETHAEDAAGAVEAALGERVAGIVALHVAAKRYLVATEQVYGGVLTPDSVVSLGRQGGAMTEDEVTVFRARHWSRDAVTLRRADDSGKVEGLDVLALGYWVPILRQLSEQAGGTETRTRG
jgi:predicted HD phosphohydrolase